MPPALENLWLQALLFGFVFAAIGIYNKVNPLISASSSWLVAIVVYATNAVICGVVTFDANPTLPNCIHFGIRAFSGSMYVLMPLLPYFAITPITVLILLCLSIIISNNVLKGNVQDGCINKSRSSIANLLLVIGVFSIASWQLTEFIEYDAF